MPALSYPTEVLALTPDAYWRFGEASGTSFADSSGNSRTMTSTGSVTAGATSLLTGDANNALTLGGGTASSAAFFTSGTSFSVAAIVKFDTLATTRFPWIVGAFGSANGYLQLRCEAGTSWKVFFSGDGSNKSTTISCGSAPLVVGQVYSVVVTVNTSTKVISLYQDGGLLDANTYTGAFNAISNKAVTVGNSAMDGVIDEVALFPTELSAANARNLFLSARGIDPDVTTYYAGPSGIAQATGTIGDPFDLRLVLQMPGLLREGITLRLLDGTYADSRPLLTPYPNFIVTVSGASGNPLIIRPHADAAKIDGGLHRASTLDIRGSYTHFIELEVFKSDPTRTTSEVGPDPAIGVGVGALAGFYYSSVGNKLINSRLHDGGIAVATQTGSELEAYGNLVYNHGWLGGGSVGWGESFYVQNDSDVEKLMEDNIVFNGYKFWQLRYNASEPIQRNVKVKNNAIVNTSLEALRGRSSNITFEGNQQWNSRAVFGENLTFNTTGTFINNRIYAGLTGTTPVQFYYWDSLTVTGNELVEGGSCCTGAQVILAYNAGNGQSLTSSTFANNDYWRGRTNKSTLFQTQSYNAGVTTEDERTFPNWQLHVGAGAVNYDTTASGSSNTDSPLPATPTTNRYVVLPNRYVTGRANLIAWNWELLASIPFNLSTTGLVDGQEYEIRNAFNWDAGVYDSGTYDEGSPTTTLTPTTDRALRIGDEASTPTISTQFQAFVLMPGDAPAGTPDSATDVSTSLGTSVSVIVYYTNPASGVAATGVTIERSTDGVSYSVLTTGASTTTGAQSYTDTTVSVDPKRLYYFRVARTNGSGSSAYSDPVTSYTPVIFCYAVSPCSR